MQNVLKKVSETTELLRKPQNILPMSSLIKIYKCFIRPHLNNENIIYGQAYNTSFHKKLKSIKCSSTLTIT